MLLSIIIPVYNVAEYLKKSFSQFDTLYQSSISFELIYVNDGSTDNSLEVLNEIAQNNSFVTVVSQENQGSSGARNTAIPLAKGKYIQFLDADDTIDFNQILELLKKAISDNLDLLGYRLDYVDENNIKIGERAKQQVPHNTVITGNEALIDGYQPSSICVFLFRKDFLLDENLRITPKITHMDVEFMTRVMLKAKRILFVDVVAYHYLQRLGSITKPKTVEKIQQLLRDEIIISDLMRANLTTVSDEEVAKAVTKNYNSVVWNLLWRLAIKPSGLALDFKYAMLKELETKKLYPIKGELKSNFQNLTRFIFNRKIFLLILLKLNK